MTSLQFHNLSDRDIEWEHPAVARMKYEIREIVTIAQQLESLGLDICWENIGDPIQRGHEPPLWIREIIKSALDKPESYAYVSSQGHLPTRQFLAERNNNRNGTVINADDILFFNGLGDAISTLYQCLNPEARVLIPSPVYSTHGAFEKFHASNLPDLQYSLDPHRDWKPDLDEIEKKLSSHPEIIAILMINPDNPTGAVQDLSALKSMTKLARKYNVCIIVDEVYAQVVWGEKHNFLSEYCAEVPAISLQGISKDLPWPGARCGWMEFYNRSKHKKFNKLVSALIRMKTMEVCATTLPQIVIPQIMSHPKFSEYLLSRSTQLMQRSNQLYEQLKTSSGLIPHKSKGSLFGMLIMDSNCFPSAKMPPVEQKYLEIIKPHLSNIAMDKIFTYYLLATTGICAVPLSSFHSDLQGIRITLLEKSESQFSELCRNIQQAFERFYRFNYEYYSNPLEAAGK